MVWKGCEIMVKPKVPLKVKLEMVLMEANRLGLNEVNLEFNPKKLQKLIKKVV